MATKEEDRTGVYEAPHSKAPDSKAAGAKDSKEVARPKDETGPYVPDKQAYFAGIAFGGLIANATTNHRVTNAAAQALKLANEMLVEMRKPPALPDEELQQQRLAQQDEQRERVAKQRQEQEAGRQKQDQERDKHLEGFAKEQEKVDAAAAAERDRDRERATARQ
jgi:hypothetical protein